MCRGSGEGHGVVPVSGQEGIFEGITSRLMFLNYVDTINFRRVAAGDHRMGASYVRKRLR